MNTQFLKAHEEYVGDVLNMVAFNPVGNSSHQELFLAQFEGLNFNSFRKGEWLVNKIANQMKGNNARVFDFVGASDELVSMKTLNQVMPSVSKNGFPKGITLDLGLGSSAYEIFGILTALNPKPFWLLLAWFQADKNGAIKEYYSLINLTEHTFPSDTNSEWYKAHDKSFQAHLDASGYESQLKSSERELCDCPVSLTMKQIKKGTRLLFHLDSLDMDKVKVSSIKRAKDETVRNWFKAHK